MRRIPSFDILLNQLSCCLESASLQLLSGIAHQLTYTIKISEEREDIERERERERVGELTWILINQTNIIVLP